MVTMSEWGWEGGSVADAAERERVMWKPHGSNVEREVRPICEALAGAQAPPLVPPSRPRGCVTCAPANEVPGL